MKISHRGEYALKCLMALSFNYGKGVVQLRSISEKEGIPYKFLEQIMIALKQGGLVKSQKGKLGGYQLSRSPEEISLGEVIRLIDGPLAPLGNESELKKLVKERGRHSGLYAVLLDVRNACSAILDKQSLRDICVKTIELQEKGTEAYMYFI
ncbi:MAG: Rrf2 family transcriptional regulator [Candidatus Omnitrophica bacterium]|nr:Rrf2 family transcriptional regulator [Candidatus Omnitrophota bacterium]